MENVIFNFLIIFYKEFHSKRNEFKEKKVIVLGFS